MDFDYILDRIKKIDDEIKQIQSDNSAEIQLADNIQDIADILDIFSTVTDFYKIPASAVIDPEARNYYFLMNDTIPKKYEYFEFKGGMLAEKEEKEKTKELWMVSKENQKSLVEMNCIRLADRCFRREVIQSHASPFDWDIEEICTTVKREVNNALERAKSKVNGLESTLKRTEKLINNLVV